MTELRGKETTRFEITQRDGRIWICAAHQSSMTIGVPHGQLAQFIEAGCRLVFKTAGGDAPSYAREKGTGPYELWFRFGPSYYGSLPHLGPYAIESRTGKHIFLVLDREGLVALLRCLLDYLTKEETP